MGESGDKKRKSIITVIFWSLMQTMAVSAIPSQTKPTVSLLCTQQQSLCSSVFSPLCVYWSWLHCARTTQNPAIACRAAEGLQCSCETQSKMAAAHLLRRPAQKLLGLYSAALWAAMSAARGPSWQIWGAGLTTHCTEQLYLTYK